MSPTGKAVNGETRRPRVPRATWLALALVAAVWASAFFGAEARLRRATLRLVRQTEKGQAESPVALGLSAHRFGERLAADAVLEVDGWGPIATGRTDVVQFYATVRQTLDEIALADPKIASQVVRRGEIEIRVAARYRLSGYGEVHAGAGRAALRWLKGDDGWRIQRAFLVPDPADAARGSWP